MSLVSIIADLPNIDNVLSAVERAQKGQLPYTREAIRTATELVQRTWIQYASGAYVTFSGGTFKINVVSGDYIRSIQEGIRFPEDLTGEVVSTAPHAHLIEEGFDAFDMKPSLLSSSKAKPTKDGGKYITVPFRHGVPGSNMNPMPAHIYEQARRLAYSRKRNMIMALLTRRQYKWGGRLGESFEGMRSHIGTVHSPNAPNRYGYTWRTGQFSGMVRMGKPNHTQYLTFRRVSTKSDPRSWIHPGVRPRPITEAVVENTRNEILEIIRTGFEVDLYFMGLGGE